MDFLERSRRRLQKHLLQETPLKQNRSLKVIGCDGRTLKGLTDPAAESCARLKEMDATKKDNQKTMNLLERIMTPKVDSPAVQIAPHAQVTQVPSGVERQRCICSDCGGVGHTLEICWKLHPEKRPIRLGSITIDPA
jgi:hypothetical protein